MEGLGYFFSAIFGFIIIIAIILIAFGIFVIIVNWKLFEKAGKPGWKSLIPIYNNVILLEIAGYNWYYVFLFCLYFIPVLGSALYILFGLSYNIKIARSFDQSPWFGVGLCLLSPVFRAILIFDKKINYIGPVVKGDIDFNDLF